MPNFDATMSAVPGIRRLPNYKTAAAETGNKNKYQTEWKAVPHLQPRRRVSDTSTFPDVDWLPELTMVAVHHFRPRWPQFISLAGKRRTIRQCDIQVDLYGQKNSG